MKPNRRLLASALALALLLLAAPPPTTAAEPLVVGQTFIAPGLDPAVGAAGWALVSHGIAEKLFTVGRDGVVAPQLAATATRLDDRTWTVTLAPGRLFSDGAPVDAAAVAASLGRTSAENPAARASVGRLAFEPTDALTLTVAGERPVPNLPSVLAEWTLPVYRQVGDNFVFTGPWAVTAFEPDRGLTLAPNPHFSGADERPAIALRRFADSQALALAAQSGEVDLAFNVPVEAIPRLAATPGVTVKSFPVAYQYMMWMNTGSPSLADARVRQAIDLAVNRDDLALAIRGGVPATGAFAAEFPFSSPTSRAFDPARAAALLDDAGWRLDGGVRRKGGRTLTLNLVAYPQRPDLVTFQPVIKAALKAVGIEVATQVSENVSRTAADGAFDLLLWAQHTAAAGDPAFFLNLFLRSGAANNHARFSSPALDAVLDRFAAASDPQARAAIARDAEAIVFEAAPVAYLLTPVWHLALSDRLADYEPWGSDYHILRPDLTAAP